jgi:hypothetical protein
MAELTLPRPVFNWNWRRDLTYFFVTMTEILWLVPLIELLSFDPPPELYPQDLSSVFALVGANVLGALALRRYLTYRRMTTREQFPYLILGTMVGIVLTLAIFPVLTDVSESPDFNLIHAFTEFVGPYYPYGIIFTPFVILLWVRGYYIGRGFLTHVAVGTQMRLGILVFFLLGILGNAELRDTMLTLLPVFFASALMSTALARSATLQIQEEIRQSRFGLSWLGFISLVVFLLTMGGFFMALLLSGVDRGKVVDVMELIGVGIITLLFIVLTPVFWVGEKIVSAIQDIASERGAEVTREGGPRESVPAKDVDRLEYGETLEAILEFVSDTFVIITVVTFVGIALYFWISAFLTREDFMIGDDEHESLDNREIIGGLRKALSNQFKKLGDALNMVRQFGIGRGLVGILTIRFAYARMEREAKRRGYPRDKARTPYEFRPEAAKAFPGGEAYIRTITEAYVAIRYGELPESSDKLEAVRSALDRLLEIPEPTA